MANNSDSKKSVIVGLFTLLGIIFFVSAIFVLGGNQKRFTKTISLRTILDNAGGLKAGNNVFFSGVKIGTIKKIKLVENSHVEIDFSIEQKSQDYIRKDAEVRISSEGFIGNKIIVIQGGSPNVAVVEEGDLLQSVKSIDTEEMMATLQVNNQNLVAITNDVKKLSEKIASGEGTIGAILTDSTMALQVKAIMASLTQTASNTAKVSSALNAFTTKLNTKGSLANEILTDTSVYKSLRSSAAQLQGITQSATALTENLASASEKMNSKDNTLGALLNDEEMAVTMKQTMCNLEESTDKLNQNMEALQHNFLFRGFFKKQAKEKEKEAKAAAEESK
ncbi:MlaD family protein [Olivibacter sp. XZL3]|uniref:MlaD family protein n=1 Tax=Olivibacter sp. XZL3 TaxID=1735116 RepID=UPI0010656CA6|nr:MlaD family protein [Olivibacter sp. XZL3]